MKTSILYLLLIISINLNAQEYPEMVVDGTTWINNYPSLGIDNYFVYHIDGDTMLNEVAYKILNQQDFEIGEDDVLRILETGIPVALLREDIEERKVYSKFLEDFEFIVGDLEFFEQTRLPGEYDNEYLLYDFSLEIGDVIGSEIPRTVSNIYDFVRFDYEVRLFSLSTEGSYFEKIGNPLTLFLPLNAIFIQGGAPSVVHFCGDDDEPCIYLTEPLSISDIDSNDISLFPNPTTDYIKVSFSDEEPIRSIQFYASDGRLIHSIKDIAVNEINVDLSFISYTGLLHVVLRSEKGIYSDSFMKR